MRGQRQLLEVRPSLRFGPLLSPLARLRYTRYAIWQAGPGKQPPSSLLLAEGGTPRRSETGPEQGCRNDEPQSGGEEEEPGPSYQCLYVTYVTVPLLVTLPPRHLLCIASLYLLGVRYPGLWDQEGFYLGVAEAVRTIFSCFAAEDISRLDGLVDEKLLARLATPTEPRNAAPSSAAASSGAATSSDDAAGSGAAPYSYHEAQRWVAPPTMKTAKVVGLSSVGGVEESESKGRSIQVTAILYTQEEYIYEDDQPMLHYRIQSWTFERNLEEDGHWRLVDTDGDWCLVREPE